MKSNKKNRPLNIKRAEKYANEIKKGNWIYNGETIKISPDGIILDGQHRLQAIIIANKSIDSEVITNIQGDVFSTIDNGRARTNGDLFSIKGVGNGSAIAAIINPLYTLNTGRYKSLGSIVLSKTDTYDYYLRKKTYIDPITIKGSFIKGIPNRFLYASQTYLNQYNDVNIVSDFFDQLWSGKIKEGNTQILILREWCIQSALNAKAKPSSLEIVAKILKAFKNIKENKNPPWIRWAPGQNEPFPYDENHENEGVDKK